MCLRGLLLGLLLGFVPVAAADDGWWSSAGGMQRYGKGHPSIRMVSEDLKIHLSSESSADVDVLFTFQNEGNQTDVTMAFPERYQMRVGGSLENFRTWVDGNRVAVRRKVISSGDPKAAEQADEIGEAVWLKKVRFAANQTHVVRVRYTGMVSGDTSGNRSFNYTLTTGATWKGPIGTCKIAVSWPAEMTSESPTKTNLSAPEMDLAPAKWQFLPGRKAVAILKNWKPKDDLTLNMYPGFGNFWINGKRVDVSALRDKDLDFHEAPTIGLTRDPLIKVKMIESFLGDEAETATVASRLKSYSNGAITLSPGKRLQLARKPNFAPFDGPINGSRREEFVYIKDLVEAAGGRFRYNPDYGRVELTL